MEVFKDTELYEDMEVFKDTGVYEDMEVFKNTEVLKLKKVKLKPCLFILRIGKLQHIAVAFSAPLAFNSTAQPLVCCYSFDVPGGYLVELTIGI